MSFVGYLARQPIIDAQHQLFGYELLFRGSATMDTAIIDNPLQAGVEIIHNTLCIGTDWLLNGKLAFINLDEAMLMSDFITLLPAQNVVCEILETVQITPAVIQRVAELKQLGYRIALDDYVHQPEYLALMPQVDFIKLDVLGQPPEKIAGDIRQLRQVFKGKLVAEKVESWQIYDVCRSGGVDYFQGYYFSRPENVATIKVLHTQATVLDLLNRIRSDVDLNEVDDAIRRDAALTYKLLRLSNSAAFGLKRQVCSVSQAITVIGFKALYRWLSLLLFTASSSRTARVIAHNAAMRGRLCELLGAGRLDRNQQDELFLVGVFSMLDALFGVPLDKVMERLVLPDRIVSGVLRHEGLYGPYLELAEACESQDFERIEACCQTVSLSPGEVNSAQLHAMAWVEGLDIS